MVRAAFLIGCMCVALPALAAPPKAHRVAVYDLQADAGNESLGRVLTDAVVEEVRKLEGVAVVGMSEIKAMLDHEAQKQMLGCAQDSCVAEIAEALGVDGLVIGSLATVGTDRVLVLKRIDQKDAATAGSFTARAALDDSEVLLQNIGKAVEQMFPERALRAGAERGVSERLVRRLDPPPVPPPLFYGTAIATGVVVAGAGALTAPALLSLLAFDTYKTDPANKDDYELKEHNRLADQAQLWIAAAAGGWALAAVGVISAGVMFPLTDFEGLGAQEERAP